MIMESSVANLSASGFKCGEIYELAIDGGCILSIDGCGVNEARSIPISEYGMFKEDDALLKFKVVNWYNCKKDHFDIINLFLSSAGKELDSKLTENMPKNDNGDTPGRSN